MSKRTNPYDYIGKKFGTLKIIGVANNNDEPLNRLSKVIVRCDCGLESERSLHSVIFRHPEIGCSKKCRLYISKSQKIDYTKYIGKKFNHLTIETIIEKDPNRKYMKRRYSARCKCDCGRYINTDMYNLITANTPKSCGQCNFSQHMSNASHDGIVGNRLLNLHDNIMMKATTIKYDQLSREWFDKDNEPTLSIIKFIEYCKPLYEKCMEDNSPKRIYIHRIDIDKPLGPGNVYFDHNKFNIHYSGKVYY